jgi:dolichol-phosphate mannosyltransferase
MKLSIVIPCFNEKDTLEACIDKVMKIQDEQLTLEVIIVDDCSTDGSVSIAKRLAGKYEVITVLKHDVNQGKGAALQTGFKKATGEFVAIQDADLEYNPMDLKRLVMPLVNDEADVVLGSRFLSGEAHRVLYFWHSMGNKFLTFLSNMFSDLNLTDMECCYKLFKREIIQSIVIQEKRFGVEPELVAKVAQMRVRIFEMGVSYAARTYEEGKKIGISDGLRAFYCIFHYNLPRAPLPIQFFIYLGIGGFSAAFNLCLFSLLICSGMNRDAAIPVSFIAAAGVNYLFCVSFLFRHKARWTSAGEILIYFTVVCLVGLMDFGITKFLINAGFTAVSSKAFASVAGFLFNFAGRRFFVFQEPASGAWKPQIKKL